MKAFWARIFLFLIPLLTLEILWESMVDRQFRKVRDRYERQVAERAERLAVAADSVLFLQRPMAAALRWFQRVPDIPLARLSGFLERASGGTAFDLYKFGSERNLLETSSPTAGNQWLMRKLLAALMESSGAGEREKELQRLLPSVFGLGIGMEWFRQGQGRVRPIPFHASEMHLTWERTVSSALLVVCRNAPDIEARFRKAREQARLATDAWCGLQAPETGWQTSAAVDPTLLKSALSRFQENRQSGFALGDRWWAFLPTRSGELLFLAQEIPGPLRQPDFRQVRLGFALALPLLAWAGFLLNRRGRVRGLVIGLFVMTALVPLGEMALATFLSLEVRRSLLMTQVERGEQEALRRLDGGLDRYLERVARRLELLTAPTAFWTAPSRALKVMEGFLQAPFHGVLEIRDAGGRVIQHSGVVGMQGLFGVFQRMSLELWFPEQISARFEKLDPVVSEFMRFPRTGFRMMSQRPRQFHLITSGSQNSFLYWDFPKTVSSESAFLTFVFPFRSIVEDFLRQAVFERSGMGNTQFRLLGVNLETRLGIPADADLLKQIAPHMERALVLGRPVTGVVSWKQERWVYTVLSSLGLQGFGLAALFPEKVIEQQLRQLEMRLAVVVLGTLFLAVGLSLLISQRFLRPVDEISRGVEAIRLKDFSYLVPIHSKDELGRLAHTFNLLAEELKDLDMARAVQTRLTTQEYPIVPGYDLYGICRFAGDLGGDILECRRLDDGRVFIMVGDVSGHGTASALLMAFVKSVVTLWVLEPAPRIEDLSRQLDHLLSGDLGGNRFLAMFACLLDPETHLLTGLSGGHPFPALHRSDGRVEFWGQPRYPLGSRRRPQTPETFTSRLEPGDSLWFYTDGLIEARDHDGRELGYEFLTAWISGQGRRDSAKEQVGVLLKEQERRSPTCDDDITLLLLGRPKNPPEGAADV